MTLHILQVSPAAGASARQCLGTLQDGDALLLIADGVYAALVNGPLASELRALAASITIHAMDDDCRARGIGDRLAARVRVIDYRAFVALACEHPRSVSWF